MKSSRSDAVQEFFGAAYPEMQAIDENIATVQQAGYTVLATHTLPAPAWVDGYYDVLGPRARQMLEHPDAVVRALAADTLQEIEIFQQADDSYGYVFYVAQRVAV
jgi:hypothetical protein